jgi:hypothetical protein
MLLAMKLTNNQIGLVMEGGCFAFCYMGWYMRYVLGNFLLKKIPSHHFTPLFSSSPFGYKLLKRKP